MYRKLFAIIMLAGLSAGVVLAQDAPKDKEKKERAERVYQLAFGGSGGYLGVALKEVSNDNYSELGLSEVKGVAVTRVYEDSAAAKAGIQKNDVIVAIDGQRVTSTRKFSRMVREVAPDHTVTLTILRSGSEMQVPVTMGRRKGGVIFSGDFDFPRPALPPMPPEAPEVLVAPRPPAVPRIGTGRASVYSFFSGRSLGVGVSNLTKQLGSYFGVPDGKGLLINDVRKDSPAESAGLRAGDVIVEVNGKPVSRTLDLMRELGREKEGPVQITFIRDKSRQTISVTPEKRGSNELLFREWKERKESKDGN